VNRRTSTLPCRARLTPASVIAASGGPSSAEPAHETAQVASTKQAILVLAALCVSTIGISLSPTSALARNTNVFQFSLGAASSTPADPYPLSEPSGVAVDQASHDIYVTDTGNHRIEKFDSSGNLVLMFGKDVNHTTGGNVCTIASGNTCQAGSSGFEPGELSAPTFTAVDNSATSPSKGDVYVGDTGDSIVSKFTENGSLIESWGTEGQFGGINPLDGVAVDQNGNLFILGETAVTWLEPEGAQHSAFGYPRGTSAGGLGIDAEEHLYKADGSPEITKFTDTGENLGEPDGTGAAVGLTIDPSSNDLFVDEAGGSISHFGLNCGQHCEPQDSFGSGHLNGARGLAVDGSNHTVYVANAGEGDVAVFVAVLLPNATTEPATEVGQTTAKLNGNADPAGGGNITGCRFEYGIDTSYSLGSVPCSPAAPYSAATDVSAEITGLTTETTYHYRLVDESAKGTSDGTDQTFKTHAVPGISTDLPTNVTASSATLNGSWVGNGEDTHYYFEYGPTESYGSKSALPPGTDGGSGTGTRSVSFELTGLTVFTGYHYRIVASNSVGTSYGEDRTFNTLGGHEFTASYGSLGPGDGQLSNPQGIAVDEFTGAIYVADTGNHRVVKFDASGNFASTWGWGVSDGNPASEICTSSCQAGIAGTGAGQFTSPIFIAVDNSGGPSSGDVYVADTAHNIVQKFDPSGNLITSWGTEGAMTYSGGIAGIAVTTNGKLIVQPGSGNGIAVDSFGHVVGGSVAIELSTNNDYYNDGNEVQEFKTSCEPNLPCSPADGFGNGILNSAGGIAINSDTGELYVANSGDNEIATFSPVPVPEVGTMPVTTEGPTSATLAGEVTPTGGATVTGCHFEYGTGTSYSLGSVPCSPATPYSAKTDVTADLSGLTPFVTYHFRLAATDSNSMNLYHYSRDRTFTPMPALDPSVNGISVSELTPTTATLSSEINPNMSATIYRFQYGKSTEYGSQTPPSDSIGSDGSDHSVTYTLSELQPATTYHFRVVAVNLNGVTEGSDASFNTPDSPAVASTAASGVTESTADLSATVRPGFRSTTYHFEYGPTIGYGTKTSESQSIGADDAIHSVSSSILGLSPLTTYHFRVVATNSIGATDGPDQTFTTAATPTITPKSVTCKAGFVKKHGKCVRKPHRKRKSHRRSN
jgi:DNA-binding beta-propeller fold protein YncE